MRLSLIDLLAAAGALVTPARLPIIFWKNVAGPPADAAYSLLSSIWFEYWVVFPAIEDSTGTEESPPASFYLFR